MPKAVKFHANERIDEIDLTHATKTYSQGSRFFDNENGKLDTKSRALRGFRIELPDQTSNPGQITVYNGHALDRDGEHLNNEEQINATRTVTLVGASTTFYIEIEFIETESDTDARAFWDPTVDNGGAPTPDGREFSRRIATRITPDWRVVTPVSTSGFAVDSDPDSTRVPLTVLTTNSSNEITAAVNPNFTTSQAASNLEEASTAGALTLKLLDTLIFPDTGSITIGVGTAASESATLLSNDRRNGILTLTAPTSNNHSIGDIVRVSGGNEFIERRTTAEPDSASHVDVLDRFYQASESRGDAYLASPLSVGVRSDVHVDSEKDWVDFTAALLRDLKFGSDLDANGDPPTSFTSRRYFDRAGSVLGAKAATVTIGDGVSSWGDYNGTDETPFESARVFLAALGGGTIFVKAGTYTFTTTVAFSSGVNIVGESASTVAIVSNVAAAPTMSVTSGAYFFKNLAFSVGTGDAQVLSSLGNATLAMDTVSIAGGFLNSGTTALLWNNVTVNNTGSEDCIASASQIVSNSLFNRCTFDITTSNRVFSGSAVNTTFLNCVISNSGGDTTFSTGTSTSGLRILGCTVFCSSNSKFMFDNAGSDIQVRDCVITCTGVTSITPALYFNNTSASTNILFAGNQITLSGTGTSVGSQAFGCQLLETDNFKFVNNYVEVATTAEFFTLISPIGTSVVANLLVEGNYFKSFARGVYQNTSCTLRDAVIANNVFDGNALAKDQSGIFINSGSFSGDVSGNKFRMTGTGQKYGIYLHSITNPYYSTISHNSFVLGDASGASNNQAIYLDSSLTEGDVSIVGNDIVSVLGTSGVFGIVLNGSTLTVSITGNNIRGVAGGAGSATVAGIYVDNVDNATISGNTIYNLDSTAIGTDTAGILVRHGTSGQVIINGNTIDEIRCSAGGGNTACIYIESSNEVTISNNYMRAIAPQCTSGILFAGVCTYANIKNNNIHAQGAGTSYGISAIFASEGPQFVSIDGNLFRGLGADDLSAFIYFEQTSPQTDCPSELSIRNNVFREITFGAQHHCIRVVNDTGSTNKGVGLTVVGNVAYPNTTAPTDRTSGVFLRATYFTDIVVNSNQVWWCPQGGNTISISNTDRGTVNGNAIRPSDDAAHEILLTSCTDILVHGNIVGNASQAGTVFFSGGSGNVDSDNKIS